jgi:hypothetical protein
LAVQTLNRPVPPPEQGAQGITEEAAVDVDEDVPPEFRFEHAASTSKAKLTGWFLPGDGSAENGPGSAPGDVLSGAVVVTVNLQVAGYAPIVGQPINRTGSTFLMLQVRNFLLQKHDSC